MRNFLAARRDRSKPVADIEQGHISAASCILANLAVDVGRTITIDPATGKVAGAPDLGRLSRYPALSCYGLPLPAKLAATSTNSCASTGLLRCT